MSGIFKTALELVKTDTVANPMVGDVRIFCDSEEILWLMVDSSTRQKILTDIVLPLPLALGGTGLTQADVDGATAGDILQLDASKQLEFVAPPAAGHVIYQEMFPFTQRPNLKFCGDNIYVTDDPTTNSTLLHFEAYPLANGFFKVVYFTAADFDNGILSIQQWKIPFTILDPIIALRDSTGRYASAKIDVNNGVGITVTAVPFSGALIICCNPAEDDFLFSQIEFTSSQFVGNVLTIGESQIPFSLLTYYALTTIYDDNQSVYGSQSVVDAQVSIDASGNLIITAEPFSGLVCLFAAAPNNGSQTYTFSASDFSGNVLSLSKNLFPSPFVNPIVQFVDNGGNYVEPSLVVQNDEFIEVTAVPFSGTVILFSTKEAVGELGHIIEDKNGNEVAQRAKLQFTGDGVSVSDDAMNNRTVVTIDGGDAGDVVRFTAAEFVNGKMTIAVPFAFNHVAVMVFDSENNTIQCGIEIDANEQRIILTAIPFDGTATIIGVN